MSPTHSIPFLLALAGVAAASEGRVIRQQPSVADRESAPSSPEADGPARVLTPPRALHDQLYFDVATDGALWVRGRTYKASFDATGATYIPFLGSDAPRNYPVGLSLASARTGGQSIALAPAHGAVREGTTIRIDRGVIDEVYELALDSIEQTFVVEERPSGGDLRLFVAIDSELTRGEFADGFEYSNEQGSVRYGRAFVRENDGTRTPIASRLVDGGVEIVIGAEQLARSTFPLVVDPIVSTFSINTALASHFEADVSYDLSTSRNATVYNEQFSGTDFDVVSQLNTSSGALISRVYVDFTSENWWGPPRIANLNAADQFLAVGTANNVSTVTASSIFGRTIQAADHTMSPKFVIAPSQSNGNRRNCDVGGDPFDGASAYYCVVWEQQGTATDSDIEFRLVTRDATLQTAVVPLTSSGVADEEFPRISESNGYDVGEARWNIVWHANVPGNGGDIMGAQVRWNGSVVTPRFAVSPIAADEAFASVSSPALNGRYVVAWESNSSGLSYDIHAALIAGSTILDTINVTAREGTATQGERQRNVQIDTDGNQYLLVYDESVGGSSFNFDVYATSLYSLPSSQIQVFAPHQVVDSTSSYEHTPALASRYSSGLLGSKRFYVAWTEVDTINGPGDVFGALYDSPVGGPVKGYCFGDGTNPTACPCGNVGITGHGCANSVQSQGGLLTHTGDAGVAADTLRLHAQGMPPNSTCTFFQGTAGNSSATPFGDGVRCTYGTVVRLKTITASPGGQASYPTGSDPDISVTGAVPAGGAIRFYQVNYRNAAMFCTSATFNITNGMSAVWLP